MNIKTSFIVATLLGSALVGQAADQLFVTGSTAFRRDVFNALNAKLTGTVGFAAQGALGANQFSFKGTWPNDGSPAANRAVEVYVGVTGSAQGIKDVVQGNNVTFVNFGGAALPHSGDAAFSDAFQDSTDSATFLGFADLSGSDEPVAVQPFVFARSVQAGAGVANMTVQQFNNMGGPGQLTKSFFTGNAADTAAIFLVGRNSESGTRIVTLAETGYGINNGIQQWRCGTLAATANADGTTNRLANDTTFRFWAASGLQSGWNSGGSVSADVRNPTPTAGCVGYMSVADFAAPGVQINYNGSAYSKDNVRNGNYTLWGYEHFYTSAALLGANNGKTQLKTSIASMLDTFENTDPTAAGIATSSMNVLRGSDGGLIQ